jgi:hypothetical protein
MRSTQTPLHAVSPAKQLAVQLPDAQRCPAGHTMPQTPQFCESLITAAQYALAPLPQLVKPAAQVAPQLPAEHT